MTQVTRLGRLGALALSKGLGHDETTVDAGGDVEPPEDQVPITGAAIETRTASTGAAGSPTLVQTAADGNNLGASTAVFASPPAEGSLITAWGIQRGSTVFNTPTGFTPVELPVGANTHGGVLYWKIAGPSESDTVILSSPGSNRKRLFIAEWTGVNSLSASTSLDEQAAATSHSIGPITPDSGVAALVIGAFVKDAQASAWTEGSGFTEDDDSNVGSAQQPRGIFEHKVVDPTSGGYSADATQPTSRKWGAILAIFIGEAGVEAWEPAPEVGDGNDSSYHVTDQDDANLRTDLGTALRIGQAILRVSTLASGTRTFRLYGSNDPDFDTEELLATEAFTSAGSYTPATLTFDLTTTAAYRYYRFKVSDADTYRYYTLSMFLAQSSTTTCGCSDTSERIAESGAAVTLDFRVANWWDVTLSDDCTVSVVGAPTPPDVGELHVVWRQPAVGGPFTITYGAEVLIPDTDGTDGGTPPTLHTAAEAEDVHVLTALDGATWGLSYDSTGGASTTFGTPAIVLGTAAAAGSIDEAIRRDSTIVAFDATAPTTQAFGDAAATGSAAVAARRDHKHAMPANPAPSFATPSIALGSSAAGGAASTVIRSDATIAAFDATSPTTQAFGDAAAVGAAAFAARRDHKHAMPADPTTAHVAASDPHTQYVTVIEGGGDTVFDHGSMGSTETIDPTDGNVHLGTLNANCTVTFGAPAGGGACTLSLRFTQDSTGGRTLAFSGSVTLVGTIDPTALFTSVLIAETVNAGTDWTVWVIGGGDIVGVLDDLSDVTAPSPAEGDTLRFRSGEWVNEAAGSNHWEILVTGDAGPEAVTTDDTTDWIYAEV